MSRDLPTGRGPARRLLTAAAARGLLTAAVVAGGVWLLLRLAVAPMAYPLLLLIVIAVGLLHRTLPDVADTRLPPPSPVRGPVVASRPATPAGLDPEGPPFGEPTVDGLRRAIAGWEQRLDWIAGDAAGFATNVQPRLVALAERRLWLRHRVDPTSDPTRTKQLAGEPLWSLLTGPVRTAPTPTELAALVATIEAL